MLYQNAKGRPVEQLWVVVEFLVTGELLRRQADEVLFVIAAHKERTGDDIIIAERTVQRKAHQLALVVQNNADVVIRERVGNIDQPADDFLLGFKGRLNVGLAGILPRFNDQDFQMYPDASAAGTPAQPLAMLPT